MGQLGMLPQGRGECLFEAGGQSGSNANCEVLFAGLGYSAFGPRTLLLYWLQGLGAPKKTTLAGVVGKYICKSFLWNLQKWDSGICEPRS